MALTNLKVNRYITVGNMLLLLGVIVQVAQWQQSVDDKLERFEQHIKDTEMHMPFREKVQTFVPRSELDHRLENIERALIKIEEKLDR